MTPATKTILGMVTGAALTLGLATAADAATYYLNGVTFDDGTALTGSFSTNVYGYVDAYDLTTVGGTLGGHHYVDTINVSYNPGDSAITFYNASPSYDGYLTLTTVNPIDSALPIALVTGEGGASLECGSYGCPNGVARYIVTGSLAASAPEPETWTLMIAGLFGIGYGIRSSRRLRDSESRLALARAA